MWKFHGDPAVGAKIAAIPATKSFRSGTWANTLLPMSRSARIPAATNCAPCRFRRSQLGSGCPSVRRRQRCWRPVRSKRRDTCFNKVLKQIPIIARYLYDLMRRIHRETLDGGSARTTCMVQPRLGVRGEVQIVVEYVLRGFEFSDLNKQAVRADIGMQGIKNLGAIQLVRGKIRIRQR